MNIRKEIERKIDKKRSEVQDLQRQIDAAKSFIDGLQEALKLAPPDEGAPAVELRAGTDLEKVRNILRDEAKPMHIDDIVTKMGKEYTGSMKLGLSGSLSTYAKKHKVFTKTAPNTFGLMEFNAPANVTQIDAANQ